MTDNERLQKLEQVLRAHGIMVDEERVEERADYIEHGSPDHAQFLGLVKAGKGEEEEFTVYKGWRLNDELSPLRFFPGVDPDKAIRAVLRQLVGELEAGRPPVPQDAPPMWTPVDEPI